MSVQMFQLMCVCLFEFVSCTVSVWHELFVLCVLHHNKLLPGFLLLCYLFSHICVKRQQQRIVHLFLLKGHAIFLICMFFLDLFHIYHH